MSIIRIPANDRERTILARRCYELRLGGKSPAEIADELFVTEQMADGYANLWADRQPTADPQESRKDELARTDKVWDEVWTAYKAGRVPVKELVDAHSKLSAIRRKLLGLDAASVVKMDHTMADRTDVELEQMISESKAKQALELDQLRKEEEMIKRGDQDI